jgi:hypothetical protein
MSQATDSQERTAALQAEKAAFAGLSKGQLELVHSLTSADNAWKKFVSSNTDGVAKIIAQGIGLLPRIFQLIQPFLAPTEKALSGFISDLSRAIAPAQQFTKSMREFAEHSNVKLTSQPGGLAQFLGVMAKEAGPSITKILKAIENLAGGIGHLLVTFAPFAQVVLTGLDKMTAGFDRWAGGLSKTKGFAEFMTMVKTQGPTIVKTLENLVTVAGYFIKDMAGSASNMLWLKVIPQLSTLAAAFMKTHSGMVEFAMNAMLVGESGKKAFSMLSSGYSTISGTAKNLNNLAKGFNDAKKAADKATGPWGTAGGKLKSAMTGVPFKNFISGFKDADKAAEESSGKMGTFGGAVKKALSFPTVQLGNLKKGMTDAEYAASDASGMMGTLGGNITKMVEAIKGWTIWSKIAAAAQKVWTGIQWAFNAAMDAMPIIAIVAAIALLVAGIIYAYIHFKTFRDVVNDIGRVLRTGFFDALHAVEKAVSEVVDFVKAHWPLLVTIILGPIAIIAALVYTHWDQIKRFVTVAVDAIVSFIKQHWPLLIGIIFGPLGVIVALVATHWNTITSLFSRGVSAVISFLKRLPGEIISLFANAGTWLIHAGEAIVSGLIHGIESMAGGAIHAVEGLGGDIKGAFMGAIHALSPSKDFANIGEMITAGLTLGINSTGQQAIDEARMLGKLVTAAAFTGGITAAQEKSLRSSITSALATALKGGVQDALASGAIGKIGPAALKMLQTIWDAAKGGDIDTSQASAMAVWVKADNVRLQTLAKARNKIAGEIAAAKQYAAGVTSSAESTYSISAAAGTGTTPASINSIISTLQGDASKIRKFKVNLTKLAKEGLNKAYLGQIIAMGPDQGGPLAAELAAANLDQIKQINAAQSSVSTASKFLGQSSADIMYDSGAQAGKGFLSGLKAQESAITKVMQQIARSMVATLRKELGIASPSRVMMQHGMMAAEGFAQGLESGVSRVTQASSLLASAASSGAASARNRSSIAGGSSQSITINLRNEVIGKMNEKEVWSALQQQTFRYNIRNTGVVTGAVRPGAVRPGALWLFLS